MFSLFYLTNRFYVAVRLLSYKSQMSSKVVGTKKCHTRLKYLKRDFDQKNILCADWLVVNAIQLYDFTESYIKFFLSLNGKNIKILQDLMCVIFNNYSPKWR